MRLRFVDFGKGVARVLRYARSLCSSFAAFSIARGVRFSGADRLAHDVCAKVKEPNGGEGGPPRYERVYIDSANRIFRIFCSAS